jgi:hypothetical protein
MTCTLRLALASTALLLVPTFTAIAQQPSQPPPSASDAAKPSLVGEALAG